MWVPSSSSATLAMGCATAATTLPRGTKPPNLPRGHAADPARLCPNLQLPFHCEQFRQMLCRKAVTGVMFNILRLKYLKGYPIIH